MQSILIGKKHAGEWQLICHPDVPHSEQVRRREELRATFPVNDTFCEVHLKQFARGVADIKSPLKFMTAAQQARRIEDHKASEAQLGQNISQTSRREAERVQAKVDAREREQREQRERTNAIHDAHRAIHCPPFTVTIRKAA